MSLLAFTESLLCEIVLFSDVFLLLRLMTSLEYWLFIWPCIAFKFLLRCFFWCLFDWLLLCFGSEISLMSVCVSKLCISFVFL